MYLDYYGLKEPPFSIAPDPRYLYMSERHREALAHLLYGVSGQGGFIVLTGEVGTGKTTICRCFLNQTPKNTDVAFIINPKLSARELLASICDEFNIAYSASASIKILNDLINEYLLKAYADNRHTVLIIDEAQNLRIDVLEQLRLLTNLETSEKKLLQIILLGQPELRDVLAQNELRQLAQRVTARYHLRELNKMEVGAYVKCRLAVAGRKPRLFSMPAVNRLYKASGGVPRLINLIADRALLGAYACQSEMVEASHIKSAYQEIHGEKIKIKRHAEKKSNWVIPALVTGIAIGVTGLNLIDYFKVDDGLDPVFSQKNDSQKRNVTENVIREPDITTLITTPVSKPPARVNERPIERREFSAKVKTTSQAVNKDTPSPDPLVADLDHSDTDTGGDDMYDGPHTVSPLAKLESRPTDRFYAYQSVFARWQVDYQNKPFMLACDFAETKGLRCLHKQGNWRSLLKLNRPAVLTLINDRGDKLYLGLLGIKGEIAHASHQGQAFQVRLDEIDRYWLGEYSILWKLPPYKSRLILPGQEHEEDKWLMSRIDELQGSANVIQGESLESKIKRFQQQAGLIPDGIVGSLTIIHIHNALQLNLPKLLDRT